MFVIMNIRIHQNHRCACGLTVLIFSQHEGSSVLVPYLRETFHEFSPLLPDGKERMSRTDELWQHNMLFPPRPRILVFAPVWKAIPQGENWANVFFNVLFCHVTIHKTAIWPVSSLVTRLTSLPRYDGKIYASVCHFRLVSPARQSGPGKKKAEVKSYLVSNLIINVRVTVSLQIWHVFVFSILDVRASLETIQTQVPGRLET